MLHDYYATTTTISLVVVLLLVVFLPRRHSCLDRSRVLTSRLRPDRLDALLLRGDPDYLKNQGEAYAQLGGARTVAHMLWDLTILVRVLQLNVLGKVITPRHAQAALSLAAGQLIYTVFTVPEALLGLAVPVAHTNGLTAMQYHVAFTLRMATLLSEQGFPEFV